MKATEDYKIVQELELDKEFMTIEGNSNEATTEFDTIAKKLFEEYQIAKGNTRYDIEEVEFYLYTVNHTDNKHVYPRVCKAGEWFVHYSGVDLTFKTCINKDNKVTQCGGILIRRIKKENSTAIGGPLRCLMELFNGQDAPLLVKKEKKEVDYKATPRIGIKNKNVQDERKYRFVISNLKPEIETIIPQYTIEGIEKKEKKYKYAPQYEE